MKPTPRCASPAALRTVCAACRVAPAVSPSKPPTELQGGCMGPIHASARSFIHLSIHSTHRRSSFPSPTHPCPTFTHFSFQPSVHPLSHLWRVMVLQGKQKEVKPSPLPYLKGGSVGTLPSCGRSCMHPSIESCDPTSFIHSFTDSFVCSFVHSSFMHPFI